MRFADPHWLIVGLVVVALLAALLLRSERLRSRALATLGGARTGARAMSPLRRWLRVALATLAVAMGFVALARPQKGMHWETVDRQGTDLLLVVDTSKSMDADDVRPTRLERSKLAIRDLVERFPGDRIGLVAFAGDAFVQSPMTLDHGALLESVDALDTSVIARGGTDIGRGIDVATEALATEPGHQKVMVLMTDGEDLEGQGLAEAKRAAAAGITIDTVGVGTAGGELVPAKDERGATIGVTRDEAGNPVRSHLDERGLEAIAASAHGEYRPLGVDGRGLDRLYDESLASMTRHEASARTRRVYSDWFEVPLSLSLLLLVLESLLGRRWRALGKPQVRRPRMAAPAIAAAAGFALLGLSTSAHASIASAQKAYAAGHFEDAAKDFETESARDPKDARLAFNAGDAAYRAGHYDAAAAAFKRALEAADPHLQQRVLYNEGDVLYRVGESKKPEERAETIAQWKAAIGAYDGALSLDPKDADARFNRDLVKRRLAELEQKPQEQPQTQDSKSGDTKKDESKDGDSKKNGANAGDSKKDGKASSASQGENDGKEEPAKGGSGAKGDAKVGAKPQTPAPGSQGQPGNPSPSPGSTNGRGQAPPTASSPAQPGDGNEGQASDAKAPQAPDGQDGAQPGRLSPRDARALLGSLRGDERHGVTQGRDAGAATDDAPGKDW